MEQDDAHSLSSSANTSSQNASESAQKPRKSSRKQPGHAAAKAAAQEPTEWKLGDYCESCDHTKSWYRCKIIQVEEQRVKVHFCGWNSRYDTWLAKDSSKIRAEKKPAKTNTVESKEQVAARKHHTLPNGAQVMAKWIDETYYPAKIARSLTKNQLPYYEVKFYDGVRKTIRFNNVRLAEHKELGLFEPSKTEEVSKRRAEAELLLAIQQPVLLPNEAEQEKSEAKSARKSLRVKRLRTFTDEIVFDSPSSSIAYNLASMKKERPAQPDVPEEKKKAAKVEPKMEVKMEMEQTGHLEEEKRKRKKSKKDKRKLFEELIRKSKVQLQKQQKLIAKQLEEHSLKKSQKKLQKMIKKHQALINREASIDHLLPISCTVPNCSKTFRKQSLLDYHLKYHHYVNKEPSEKTSEKRKSAKPKKKKKEAPFEEYCCGNGLKSDDEMDPYEVIHCKCSDNINKGFMIQCEVCLCWQHGDCESIRSNKQVPDNYLCWVCSEPANNLKNLKHQSWIKSRIDSQRRDACASQTDELSRLKMLNECSKHYYGLSLLMYTLEFQMSLFNQLVGKNKNCMEPIEQSVDANADLDYDDQTYDHLNRLSHNITHLQDSIAKQFNEFDSKLEVMSCKKIFINICFIWTISNIFFRFIYNNHQKYLFYSEINTKNVLSNNVSLHSNQLKYLNLLNCVFIVIKIVYEKEGEWSNH
ncbi:PHD finger 20 1 isoform X3 [Brachionus plicatilis]|uniref:PHD finger 20 1 isoform X3 n=1 Tax=Brachionus plicatilis TaxID=10195 RepID=A0A3M7SN74_BRAPC|nr:PHD finger 20 1 isoform X3 [Brachionus plicatilis]